MNTKPRNFWQQVTTKDISTLGWLLFIIGIAITVGACTMDTTVSTGDGSRLQELTARRVHNQGKLNDREVNAQVGMGLAICGAVLINKKPQ